MFGYITIRKEELKMKDYYTYKAFYCGLCRTLQESYGRVGQGTLTYDMTFFVIFLTSLYESIPQKELHRCVVHPLKKQAQMRNELTQYAADMNMIMSYYHFKDDWEDEKKALGLVGMSALKKHYHKLCATYPRQSSIIQEKMQLLSKLEKRNEANIDLVSGTFGELMGEIFVYQEDQWSEQLRRFGLFLGKFIYIMDAYDDLNDDITKKLYNPLKPLFEKEPDTYEEKVAHMLTLMMADATDVFEKLPCLELSDILRNILYVGVWEKFDAIHGQTGERN